MTKYGKVIDGNFGNFGNLDNSSSNNKHSVFHEILGGQTQFTKINDTVYATLVKTLLGKYKRYVLVVVNNDTESVGTVKSLKSLNWDSIQLRSVSGVVTGVTTTADISLFNISRSIPIKRYNIVKGEGTLMSEYYCDSYDSPYKIVLIHTTDSEFEYISDGTLISALTTWNTLISHMTKNELYDINK